MKKYLMVGLGNVGSEYTGTRHNVGFEVLNKLASSRDLRFTNLRLGEIAEYTLKGKRIILLKPSTFMNLSGNAVSYWMNNERIPLEHLLVIADDLNLPFGTLRIKGNGSDGGHNGLKDIQARLETKEYARLRFGIGVDFGRGQQVNYVLGTWSPEQQKTLPERLNFATSAVESFVLSGLQTTMNEFNGK